MGCLKEATLYVTTHTLRRSKTNTASRSIMYMRISGHIRTTKVYVKVTVVSGY